MRKMKKVVSVIAAAAMAASLLAGCGGSGGSSTTAAETKAAETTAARRRPRQQRQRQIPQRRRLQQRIRGRQEGGLYHASAFRNYFPDVERFLCISLRCPGCKFDFFFCDGDFNKWQDTIRTCASAGYDGLLVSMATRMVLMYS